MLLPLQLHAGTVRGKRTLLSAAKTPEFKSEGCVFTRLSAEMLQICTQHATYKGGDEKSQPHFGLATTSSKLRGNEA